MTLIDLIRLYANSNKNSFTKVILEWFWVDTGTIDEEYSFEGTPCEFIEKYTEHYDCIDGYDICSVHELKIIKDGSSEIYIEIVAD